MNDIFTSQSSVHSSSDELNVVGKLTPPLVASGSEVHSGVSCQWPVVEVNVPLTPSYTEGVPGVTILSILLSSELSIYLQTVLIPTIFHEITTRIAVQMR